MTSKESIGEYGVSAAGQGVPAGASTCSMQSMGASGEDTPVENVLRLFGGFQRF